MITGDYDQYESDEKISLFKCHTENKNSKPHLVFFFNTKQLNAKSTINGLAFEWKTFLFLFFKIVFIARLESHVIFRRFLFILSSFDFR